MEKQRPDNGAAEERRDAGKLGAEDESSPEEEKTGELDDALVSSMVLETPKISAQRPPMDLSREMRAALKVLDDNLRYDMGAPGIAASAGASVLSFVKDTDVKHCEYFYGAEFGISAERFGCGLNRGRNVIDG